MPMWLHSPAIVYLRRMRDACAGTCRWGGGLGVPVEGQLVPQRGTAVRAVCALTALCLIAILVLASRTRELC